MHYILENCYVLAEHPSQSEILKKAQVLSRSSLDWSVSLYSLLLQLLMLHQVLRLGTRSV